MNAQDRTALNRLITYLKPHIGLIMGSLAAMALVAGAETSIPALMKPLLDRGFTGQLNSKLWQVPVFLVGLALVRSLAQFLSNYLLTRVINAVLLKLREQMFQTLLHAKTTFFQQNSASNLINAVVFEVNSVLSVMGGMLISLVRDSLTVVGLIGYLIYLNWKLTLVVLVIFPVIALIMSKINRRLRALNREQQTLTSDLAYIVEEAASGYRIIKVHGAEEYEMERFMEKAERLRQFALKSAVAGGLNQPITQLIASIALSVVLVIALMQSATEGTTVGGFAAFITAMMLVISPLKHLADINQPLQRGLTAAEMIFGLMDQPLEEDEDRKANMIALAHAKGAIRFEKVGFSYQQEVGRKDALIDINLDIQPGEVVAFVGPSGGGKSTLVNLLPRFFKPTSGHIFLDGIPLEDIVLSEVRKQIAFVSQDVILFNDSIAANVAYGAVGEESVDRGRVIEALEAANLSSLIRDLPEGIDSLVGDNGNRLSGGQRQRLAIARAIYKNAPILILDEATSALDSESERQVQDALERLMAGRTTLVIAHRLSTIEHANRIVVLENGKVVENGSHEDLIKHDGLYANLHRIQFSNA
ncbi:lipid A export permease/ATP-binding protein MsbA [Polynucleobacter asymbioticus]|uniref:Lipid ABC transporter permease/ATP-binding protein n=1 Tax=Polynucleobacter asymbioticus TaxID=576611 RepID=A0AAC9IWJ1_9BURK|nr:lipid A export permease/ATP-binding protein MsbA [Polynucleobacter asymbioticus]APC00010.1 lipid ABC transporter permease/ATP-binding protein [Polynucleobacter asymbioticus]APC02313.1 lipid ABC transporter permease/ATP-binding protein [Polynucleobacter asymbioticus]